MYSLEQLKMFVLSAELGSFSAAARKLEKAQSAVSQGIANLEIDLGNELFSRTGRSPVITAEGRRLLPLAKAMLRLDHDMEKTAKSLAEGHEDELMLAVDEALMIPAMSRVLTEFAHHFPATALNIHTVASPDVHAMVADGKAQLGLTFADTGIPPNVSTCYLGSLPFVVVANPEHPLAKQEQVDVDCLQHYRQLLVKGFDGSGLAYFPSLSTDIWWTNTFYLLRELARQGLGWSYVPLHLVEHELEQGLLVRLPISFDHNPWQAPVERVMAKYSCPGLALGWLAEKVAGIFSDH
ncbi:LysR family transcriptional regulator [Kistimonas asteriae]|uniref:LysR family transcriptional regulator n=1 Tax=Kistimonas asteriae TaxID=517724 RepID=UPI002484B972|nr:LysR family transcriptional regulator [Kistimonas asteriae]